MKAIVSKNIWLWPLNWRLTFVIAKDKKINLVPRIGFSENKGRTYFVIVIGKIYAGLRLFQACEDI